MPVIIVATSPAKHRNYVRGININPTRIILPSYTSVIEHAKQFNDESEANQYISKITPTKIKLTVEPYKSIPAKKDRIC